MKDLLKVAKSTVYHVVTRFKEPDTSEIRNRSKQQRTTRTTKIIKAVREWVRWSSKRSARSMVKDMNVTVLYENHIQKPSQGVYLHDKKGFIYTILSQKYNGLESIFLENWKLAQQSDVLTVIEVTVNNQNDRVYSNLQK